jgi:hypothetical protein
MQNVALEKIVATPLGELLIRAYFEGTVASSKLNFRQVKPSLSKGMAVDNFDVCALEFATEDSVARAKFECIWKEELKIQGSPESGEWLDAQEWYRDGKTVLIGTEDYEALHSRMPEIFKNENPYPIEYLKNGLRVTIPEVPAHTKVFLHYAIASNASPELVEESCWFAVGVLHKQVIEAQEKN